jgi:predicted DNA-binding transcriptional regulator AlpA
MHPEQMTTAQVVEEYGLSRRTLYRRIETGDLHPTMKLPGTTGAYLFTRAEIERALGKGADVAAA